MFVLTNILTSQLGPPSQNSWLRPWLKSLLKQGLVIMQWKDTRCQAIVHATIEWTGFLLSAACKAMVVR